MFNQQNKCSEKTKTSIRNSKFADELDLNDTNNFLDLAFSYWVSKVIISNTNRVCLLGIQLEWRSCQDRLLEAVLPRGQDHRLHGVVVMRQARLWRSQAALLISRRHYYFVDNHNLEEAELSFYKSCNTSGVN